MSDLNNSKVKDTFVSELEVSDRDKADIVESLIEKDKEEKPTEEANLLFSRDSTMSLTASPDTFRGSKVKWLVLAMTCMTLFGPVLSQSILGVLGPYFAAAPYNYTSD
jgi:hypothetical protein